MNNNSNSNTLLLINEQWCEQLLQNIYIKQNLLINCYKNKQNKTKTYKM